MCNSAKNHVCNWLLNSIPALFYRFMSLTKADLIGSLYSFQCIIAENTIYGLFEWLVCVDVDI